MIADGAVLTAHYGAASIVSAALADDASVFFLGYLPKIFEKILGISVRNFRKI